MASFWLIYALCASAAIFLSFFAVTAFVGFVMIDIWSTQRFPKTSKILLSIGLALFPEIGVLSWVLYFGKNRRPIFRIIAGVASGLYLFFQIGFVALAARENGFGAGVNSALAAHCLWLPFILVGGSISFFILKAILSSKSTLPA